LEEEDEEGREEETDLCKVPLPRGREEEEEEEEEEEQQTLIPPTPLLAPKLLAASTSSRMAEEEEEEETGREFLFWLLLLLLLLLLFLVPRLRPPTLRPFLILWLGGEPMGWWKGRREGRGGLDWEQEPQDM
jgi:hypothetical protein